METRVLIQSVPKTICSLFPTPVMLHTKFDQDWPTGFRAIEVWKCGWRTNNGRRMDAGWTDGPLVYYKLILWAFSSGELINQFITSRNSKSMKSRGFTKTLPLVYVPSVINRFTFGHWVLIYFIMQSLLKKSKNLPCFPSKRESLQYAILFILSTAAAILMHSNLMKSFYWYILL